MREFDFYSAWHWLRRHPIFFYKGEMADDAVTLSDKSGFIESLDIAVVKVNPTTQRVEDDTELNTATRVWLECGPWDAPENHPDWDSEYYLQRGMPTHDIDLDCGGNTLEEAIVELASLVFKKYGDHNNVED